MELIKTFADKYFAHVPSLRITDIVEILIISFLVYHIMVWIKNTKAWALFKGVVLIMVFIILAAVFEMNTILWIARNVVMYGAVALVVVLQPELRKALEQLGKKEFLASLLPFEIGKTEQGLFSDKTVHEIAKACVEMARSKPAPHCCPAERSPDGV